MARLSKEDYTKIYQKYGVDKVWSFSKVETYKQDKYEYFLKYIKKIQGDRQDSAYAPYGTLAHDLIEDYYNDKIKKEDILNLYETKTLELEMLGKKFDRTDEQKNEKIKNDYEICMKDFFMNCHKPNTNFMTELPVVVDLASDVVMIGYIDFIEMNNDKITITDFKTSTIYSSADMKNKTAQLMLYAEAIRKKKGLENFDNIKIQYNFLKYVKVEYTQLNGKIKTRNIKRSELGVSLINPVKTFAKNMGYNDYDIDMYSNMLKSSNSLNGLPEELKNKFYIADCIMEVPISNEIIEEFKKDFVDTVHKAVKDENDYIDTLDEKIFWSDIDTSKSFYFANSSEYSMDLHKPYKQYLVRNGLLMDTLQKQEQNNINNNTTMPSINSNSNNNSIDDKWKDLFGD